MIPFFDNFEDGDAFDGSPVSWLVAEGSSTVGVVDGDFVVSPINNGPSVSMYVEGTLDPPDNTSDVSVRSPLRFLEFVDSAGVFARGSETGSYFAGVSLGSEIFVGQTGGEFLITNPTTLNTSEPVFVQLDVQDIGGSDLISVTAWQAGDTMPMDPQLSFTDATPRVGSVGVWVDARDISSPGSVAFSNFSAQLDPGAHVPEPASFTLMVLALVGLLGFAYRQREASK